MAKKKRRKLTWKEKRSMSPHRRKKYRRNWAWLKAFFITLFLMLFLAGCGVVYYGYDIIRNAPPIDPTTINDTLDQTSEIYDDQGVLFDEIYYDENRKIISYEQLPENLKNAFISIEDKTFWEHKGFNFRRIFGALLDAYNGGRISGTSTISQQLARNIFLPEEKEVRSIERKLTEMYYAFQIEQTLSKEEILTAYLNTIYLGYNCYGVDSASRVYFSKEVEDLSLTECAALAALPQAPGYYSLLVNEKGEKTSKLSKGLYVNDISEDRRNLVLDLMAEQGMITADEAEEARKPAKKFVKPGKAKEAATSAFKDYLIQTIVEDLMNEYDLSAEKAEAMVYTKGLKIYSTLDTQAQSVITKTFKDKTDFPVTEEEGGKVQAAMVISEVGTGQVKAMAGTRKANAQMLFNRATNPRQPGSSIKPITCYAPALQKSFEYAERGEKFKFVDKGYDKQGKKYWGDYITASSKIVDERMVVNGNVWPLNYARIYYGDQTVRSALQMSLNTCAVKLVTQVGIDYSMDTLKNFGITTAVDDRDEPYNDVNLAALGLGAMTYGVTPLDMATAYATFPNGGVRNTPICYTKVVDSEGNTVLEGKSEEIRVLDEGVAWIMTDLLKSVVSDGLGSNAKIKGIAVGGKTGTTNDSYDFWFDGFTPTYAGAIWIGTDDNVSMTEESATAALIWGKIMSKVDRAYGGEYRPKPSNVIKKNGEYYTKGTEPKDKSKTGSKTAP